MYARKDRKASRVKVRRRIRARLSGSPDRPRLAIHRTSKHIYAQAVDDESGQTLVTASSLETDFRARDASGGNVSAAKIVGQMIAERLRSRGVEGVVFDRGGFRYHGRVKALADSARESGLKF
ncbi:MAG: 50S ribosomal protein L18 [Acidobacteriota bacterium]|nr:MAG: 50S ribosomal protein L18 [Acidobacteriota bacterium]